VSGPNRRFRKWAIWRPQGPGVEDLIARAQRLIDTPRPPDGYTLEWCVEANYVGDLNAIAIAALHAPIEYPAGARARNGNPVPGKGDWKPLA
jgi:hypothetical protein